MGQRQQEEKEDTKEDQGNEKKQRRETFLGQGSSSFTTNLSALSLQVQHEGKCIFLRLITHSGADAISCPMSLSDQKDTFTITSNSPKSWTQKRYFRHFTADVGGLKVAVGTRGVSTGRVGSREVVSITYHGSFTFP